MIIIDKVYLVVENEYSGKVIHGIFVNRIIADTWVQELKRSHKYSDVRVEERAVLHVLPQRRVTYIVTVTENGKEKHRWSTEEWDVPDTEFAEEDATRTVTGVQGWSPQGYAAALQAARIFLTREKGELCDE